MNFDWVGYCRTGVDWVDLEIPYPPTAGPGGPFGIMGMATPIDERSTAVASTWSTSTGCWPG